MLESFEVSDWVENKINQWEKKLQQLMTPLLEEEFLEYTEFKSALHEYQNNNPDIDISKMLEELNNDPTELWNTSLELIIHEFWPVWDYVNNIQIFINKVEERYITFYSKNKNTDKSEIKEEISEKNTDKSEVKEEISEQNTDKSEVKEEILEKNTDFWYWNKEISEQIIDKSEVKEKHSEVILSTNEVAEKYSLDTNEHFETLKNQAQIQLDKFLQTDEWKAELAKYPNEAEWREELLRKFIILSNTDKLVEAYKNTLDNSLSEEEKEIKVTEFKKDIENQVKTINRDSPDLVNFVLNLNDRNPNKDTDVIVQEILSKDVNKNLLLYGYSGEKSGNVTTAWIQKVTRNSDGSFDKSLVVNNFELKSNLPKWLDIADYQVSLSKLVKESGNLQEIWNNVFSELEDLKTKLNHLDSSNDFADLGLENINKSELEQEILLQETKLNEIQSKFEEIQNKILSVVNKFEEQSRLYQLKLKENDEKVVDVLNLINQIWFNLIPQGIVNNVFSKISESNPVVVGNNIITGLDLNTMDFTGDFNPTLGDGWPNDPNTRNVLIQLMNKMISWNEDIPAVISSYSESWDMQFKTSQDSQETMTREELKWYVANSIWLVGWNPINLIDQNLKSTNSQEK